MPSTIAGLGEPRGPRFVSPALTPEGGPADPYGGPDGIAGPDDVPGGPAAQPPDSPARHAGPGCC